MNECMKTLLHQSLFSITSEDATNIWSLWDPLYCTTCSLSLVFVHLKINSCFVFSVLVGTRSTQVRPWDQNLTGLFKTADHRFFCFCNHSTGNVLPGEGGWILAWSDRGFLESPAGPRASGGGSSPRSTLHS